MKLNSDSCILKPINNDGFNEEEIKIPINEIISIDIDTQYEKCWAIINSYNDELFIDFGIMIKNKNKFMIAIKHIHENQIISSLYFGKKIMNLW